MSSLVGAEPTVNGSGEPSNASSAGRARDQRSEQRAAWRAAGFHYVEAGVGGRTYTGLRAMDDPTNPEEAIWRAGGDAEAFYMALKDESSGTLARMVARARAEITAGGAKVGRTPGTKDSAKMARYLADHLSDIVPHATAGIAASGKSARAAIRATERGQTAPQPSKAARSSGARAPKAAKPKPSAFDRKLAEAQRTEQRARLGTPEQQAARRALLDLVTTPARMKPLHEADNAYQRAINAAIDADKAYNAGYGQYGERPSGKARAAASAARDAAKEAFDQAANSYFEKYGVTYLEALQHEGAKRVAARAAAGARGSRTTRAALSSEQQNALKGLETYRAEVETYRGPTARTLPDGTKQLTKYGRHLAALKAEAARTRRGDLSMPAEPPAPKQPLSTPKRVAAELTKLFNAQTALYVWSAGAGQGQMNSPAFNARHDAIMQRIMDGMDRQAAFQKKAQGEQR